VKYILANGAPVQSWVLLHPKRERLDLLYICCLWQLATTCQKFAVLAAQTNAVDDFANYLCQQ